MAGDQLISFGAAERKWKICIGAVDLLPSRMTAPASLARGNGCCPSSGARESHVRLLRRPLAAGSAPWRGPASNQTAAPKLSD